MSFLAPMAFAFAAAIPVVILFYLLKRKRVVRLVSSTLLWQKFLAESQASAPFQKLRKNWLLILQILLLLLAVLALARPYMAGQQKPAALRVVILDASASMQARDEAPNRFEKARQQALAWVDGLKEEDRMVIVLAGAMTEVKQSATSDKMALRRALTTSLCSDGPTRLVPALRMAESLVRDRREAEIHLFSDGATPDLSEFENKALPLVYHRVGVRSENTGITALDVRANPDDPRQRAVYVNVANYSSNRVDRTIEFLFEGRLLETRPLNIPGGESAPQVFKAGQTRDGVFEVRLGGNDDLATDDRALATSVLPRPANVLLVTRGNRILEKALRAVPEVRLSVSEALSEAAPWFDVVVLDDVTPGVWPTGNVLAIRTHPTNWFAETTLLDAPALVDWKTSHPLLRYSGFDNVQVMRSLSARAPEWAVPILEAPQAPLILAGETGRQRVIWIGFDVLESNWPLRVSFPIFIANAVEWLNPGAIQSRQLLVRAGDPLRFALSEPQTRARVTLPNGETGDVVIDPKSPEFVYGDTRQLGLYKVELGTNRVTFAVNLLDANESAVAPREELVLGRNTRVVEAGKIKTNKELWRGLGLAALALLLVEWWYFHRRSV
jgi:hypothetical protein